MVVQAEREGKRKSATEMRKTPANDFRTAYTVNKQRGKRKKRTTPLVRRVGNPEGALKSAPNSREQTALFQGTFTR